MPTKKIAKKETSSGTSAKKGGAKKATSKKTSGSPSTSKKSAGKKRGAGTKKTATTRKNSGIAAKATEAVSGTIGKVVSGAANAVKGAVSSLSETTGIGQGDKRKKGSKK
ncbi:MAG: hypothetical protein H0W76_14670 [Pyrinomonadaceae bacterium]|nr:hypothetical protein [Pyrinomonadaceae bacterium]